MSTTYGFHAFPFAHRLLEEIEELCHRSNLKEELERIQFQNGQFIGLAIQNGLLQTNAENKPDVMTTCETIQARLNLTQSYEESDKTLDRIRQMLDVKALDSYHTVEGKIGAMIAYFKNHGITGAAVDQQVRNSPDRIEEGKILDGHQREPVPPPKNLSAHCQDDDKNKSHQSLDMDPRDYDVIGNG